MKTKMNSSTNTKTTLSSLLCLYLFLSPMTQASESGDAQTGEIILPVASQGAYLGSIERPKRGQSQQSVNSQFGEPASRHGPSGEPAIIRWDYADFSVYFENDTVIHSVLKHRRLDSERLNSSP